MELSRQLDDLAQQAEPLIGHVTYCLGAADYAVAVELSDRARAIAEAAGSAEAMLGVDRVAAQAHHFNGDHATARRLARRVMEHPIARIPLAYNSTPVTRHVAMRGVLARIAWMQGSAEEAAALARQAIEFAAGDSAFALCQTLVLAAIPIAIWRGDDAAADAMTDDLDDPGRPLFAGLLAQLGAGVPGPAEACAPGSPPIRRS